MERHEDEYLTFFEATHVIKEGNLFEIYPVSGEFCVFCIVPEDKGAPIRIDLESLNNEGYLPVSLEESVKMDPETGLPEASIDHIEQMRCKTHNKLDTLCKNKLFVP